MVSPSMPAVLAGDHAAPRHSQLPLSVVVALVVVLPLVAFLNAHIHAPHWVAVTALVVPFWLALGLICAGFCGMNGSQP